MVLYNGTAGDTPLFCLLKIVYNVLKPCTLKCTLKLCIVNMYYFYLHKIKNKEKYG